MILQTMRVHVAACAGAIALVAIETYSRADDLPVSRLPPIVQEAIQTWFPKAELLEADQDTDRDVLHYDVDLRHQKRHVDVTVTAKGQITKIESRLTARELPQPVADAVQTHYPQASYTRIEETRRIVNGQEQPTRYQIHITTADRQARELDVTPSGKIIEDEED